MRGGNVLCGHLTRLEVTELAGKSKEKALERES